MPLPPEFHELARQVNNWGRWGPDDEIGTINLITPEVVRRGAACVETGKVFALGLPLSDDGPQIGAIKGRVNPLKTMVAINAPLTGDPSEFCTSDVILLRTGQIQILNAGDKIGYTFPTSGPSTKTVKWFRDHDVAAVATDTLTYEVYPCERDDMQLPVHLLHLVEMGMTQGQNFDL